MGKNSKQSHYFRIKEPRSIIASALLLQAQKKDRRFPDGLFVRVVD
jgi:hypothetical protein